MGAGPIYTYTHPSPNPRHKTSTQDGGKTVVELKKMILVPRIIMFKGPAIKIWGNDYYIRLPRSLAKYYDLIRDKQLDYTVLFLLEPMDNVDRKQLLDMFDTIIEEVQDEELD